MRGIKQNRSTVSQTNGVARPWRVSSDSMIVA
jgi:hypothetical protein